MPTTTTRCVNVDVIIKENVYLSRRHSIQYVRKKAKWIVILVVASLLFATPQFSAYTFMWRLNGMNVHILRHRDEMAIVFTPFTRE